MSDRALITLAENMNRLINKDGGVYSSNVAAEKASQGTVSKSTFDRLRNIDKIGATVVGVDKLVDVARVFGIQVWQLFIPGLDLKSPPRLAENAVAEGQLTDWPFESLSQSKVEELDTPKLAKLEAAIIGSATALGLDVKKDA